MFDFENWYSYFLYKASTHAFSYIIGAGILYIIFWVWKKKEWLYFKIQKTFPDKKIVSNEIKWSILNITITAIMNVGIFFLYKWNITKIYTLNTPLSIIEILLYLPLLLFLHDTYFYWTHRFMHKGLIYDYVHNVHHQSVNPTPFTTHSQHPLEVVLQNLFLPVIVIILPLHPITIAAFMIIATAFNLLGHLGYELFPKWFAKSWLGKIFLTSTYHNMHHEHATLNYGLYFFFWDRIMNTYNKDYYKKFEEVKSQRE